MYLENSIAASSFNFRCFSSCLEVSYLTHQKKIKDIFFLGYRSKSSPGVGGINKLDGSFELASSDAGTLLRNELESPSPRDRTTLLEQRVVKGNNKYALSCFFSIIAVLGVENFAD